MPDLWISVAILLTFFLAGVVKGVIGMGLPSVSLAILAVLIDLPSAMALLIAPSLVTNAWQGLSGGHLRQILQRRWLFLLSATLAIGLGSAMFSWFRIPVLTALLGALLALYAVLGLTGLQLRPSPSRARALAVPTGLINGVLTGLTGSFVVPGVLYLQALQLPRAELIQAMGVLFTLSTLALGVSLYITDALPATLTATSLLAVLPAVAGMPLGQRIRSRLSDSMFRRTFFVGLLLIGGYLAWSALLALGGQS